MQPEAWIETDTWILPLFELLEVVEVVGFVWTNTPLLEVELEVEVVVDDPQTVGWATPQVVCWIVVVGVVEPQTVDWTVPVEVVGDEIWLNPEEVVWAEPLELEEVVVVVMTLVDTFWIVYPWHVAIGKGHAIQLVELE